MSTTYCYDALHRVTSKTYSDGITPTATYVYDTFSGLQFTIGRLVETSNNSNAGSFFGYDKMGRITDEYNCIPSDCTSTSNHVAAVYNQAGALISLTYPSGRTVKSSYNPAGRLKLVNFDSMNGAMVNSPYYTVAQGTSPTTWGYAPSGAMQLGTYGNGVQQYLGYNNRLQMNAIAESLGGQTLFGKSYTYTDPAHGNNNNGNVIAINDTLSATRNQSFGYDDLNGLTLATQADGAFSQTFTIDPWGNTQQSGTWNFQQPFTAANQIQGYPYDGAGDLLSDTFNNYAYDAEHRIKTATRLVDGLQSSYTYGPDGERVRKDSGGNFTEYIDFAGQPIAEKTASGWTDYIFAGSERVAREDAGNKVDVRFTNDSCTACSGTPGGGDRNLFIQSVTIGSTSFAPNNPAVTYTGAPCNSYANGVGQLLCNGDLMVSAPAGGISVTVSAYGSPDAGAYPHMQIWVNDSLAGEWDVTGGAQNYTVSGTHYYASDHLGTVRMETNSIGEVVSNCTYAPFGQEASCAPLGSTNHYKFTGKERDAESGLDNFGARYDSSSLGRFMTPDWSATPAAVPFANPADPQSLNLYSYVVNNPLNRTDPTGHNWFCTSGGDASCKHWEWHKGSAYTDANGNKFKSNYTGLLTAQANGTDKKTGAQLYKLTLYDQNKAVATGTGFSGGNGMAPIRDGNYLLRLDIRDPNGPNSINPNSALNNPPAYFGIQKMHNITDSQGTWDVVGAYGPIRARLNPMNGKDEGDYFHGQTNGHGYTHGCLCYGTDTRFADYMWNNMPHAPLPAAIDVPTDQP